MTIKDIARESGYGVATVSRALNDHPDVSKETKEKIKAIVERYGFVPNSNARQLKVQQRKSVIIVVKGAFNLFFADILERMQVHIASEGYSAEVHYIDECANEVAVAAQLCRELKPQGVIFLGGNVAIYKRHFGEIELPCVLATTVSQELSFANLSMVGIDDCAAGAQACRYLLSSGHSAIGVIGGDRAQSYISARRYEGFCSAYGADGDVHDPSYYCTASFSLESGYTAMKKLLARHPDISAVFCMSDLLAIGAMRAVCDAGLRVPQDVSVMGFDGIELGAYCTPRLASLRQPQKQIADRSVEQLLAQIEKGAPASTSVLEASLVEGESVSRFER